MKIPPMVQKGYEDAKPHVMNGMSALRDGYETAKPHVINAFEQTKPHVKAGVDGLKHLSSAGMEQARSGVASFSNPLPFPIPGTARAVQPFSKELIKKGGEEAYSAIMAEFAKDPVFAALASIYTDRAKVAVADRLIATFLLASKDPTPNEIKVSLAASLGELGKEAKVKSSGASVADAAPVTIIVAKITGMLTLGLVGTKPLTKPVVKKGDTLAIIGAYAADPKFGTLVLYELEAEAGKRAAAKAMADNFLLATKSPTYEEIRTSLYATAAALVKEHSLPAKPPPLSKPLLTKTKGAGARAAVLKLFTTDTTFNELAHAEANSAVEEFKKVRARREPTRDAPAAPARLLRVAMILQLGRNLVPCSHVLSFIPPSSPGLQSLPWRSSRNEGGAQCCRQDRCELSSCCARSDGG